MMKIPFLDLVTPHIELQSEILDLTRRVLTTAGFVGGPLVEEFESAFAAFCGVRFCVGVGSGTDALRFALLAAGVGSGEVVITVPNTFIATTEAISQTGATPEFVDVDERTCNMSVEKLEKFLETRCTCDPATGALYSRRNGKKVSAILPVHLYGQMADMDPILKLAEAHGLIVVEDACQAHGAEYFSQKLNRWVKAGTMGRAAAFSFYPGKNLGACGEAGAITTNDDALAHKARMLRDHGQAKKYYHLIEGFNGRLDSLQAGILSIKLKHLADWNTQRRKAARRYLDLFSAKSMDVLLPYEDSGSRPVYHLYVIRYRDRDELRNALAQQGIETGIHYPIPLHLQEAYCASGYKPGDFPTCESVAGEIVSLPMFPTLSNEQQERVVKQIALCTARYSEGLALSAPAL